MSLTCDITGNNPLYLIDNLRYRIAATGESVKVELPQPAYLNSVVVKRINTDGSITTLTRLTHFTFDACRDTVSENLVRSAYPAFSLNLYDGFYLKNIAFNNENNIDLIIQFQSAFPNILTSAVDTASNPGGPTCSPELLRAIVEDLVLLKGSLNGSSDVGYAQAINLPSPLVTDYTGVLADNYIHDEEHYVDHISGKCVLRPSNGSFYNHDIVIRKADNTILTQDVDYTVRGMDVGSTKVCEHQSGVWRYIIITFNTAYTGQLYIDYHAFGGEVSINNFVSLQNEFIELKNYINNGAFLSSDNLGGTKVMQDVYDRLKSLDRYFRSLNMSGYRDMSNRYLATNASNDGMSHWYRIAYLYKQASITSKKEVIQLLNSNIQGYIGKVLPLSSSASGEFSDTEIVATHVGKYIITNSAMLDMNDNDYFTTYTKDSIRIKVRLEKTNIFFDLYVYANVKSGMLKLHVVEADTDNGYSEPNQYKNIDKVTLPQFRLVWRKDGDYAYGAALQMKIAIPEGEANEVVTLENHNKAGMGGWILKSDNVGTDNVEPEDTSVQLPDQLHTWLATGSSSIYGSAQAYPSFKEGTLIWAGSVPMHLMDPESDASSIQYLNTCFDGTLNLKAIDSVSITIFDRYDGTYRTYTSKISASTETAAAVEFCFDDLDMSMLRIGLSNANNKLQIETWAIVGTKSIYMEKFDLRQITINKEIAE